MWRCLGGFIRIKARELNINRLIIENVSKTLVSMLERLNNGEELESLLLKMARFSLYKLSKNTTCI